jgi:hypothetical protein
MGLPKFATDLDNNTVWQHGKNELTLSLTKASLRQTSRLNFFARITLALM